MNPDNPIIQILPLPRQLPPPVMWSMYSIIAASLVSAITVILLTSDFNSPSGSINVTTTTSDDAETTTPSSTEQTTPTRDQKEQWLAQLLRDTINYECQFHKPNVASCVTWATDQAVRVQHAYRNTIDNIKIDIGDQTRRFSGRKDTTSIAKDEDNSTKCEDNEKEPRSFHRLVSTLWFCPPQSTEDDNDEEDKDDRCRFNVKIMSTAMAWNVSNKSRELVTTFTLLSHNHSGDYTYSYKQSARDTGLPFNHRCLYRVQLFRKKNTTTKSCYIKTLEDHDYTWGSSDSVECKYTFTVTEGCPDFSVTWTDEFSLDSSSYEYSLFQPTIPRRRPDVDDSLVDNDDRFTRSTKPCSTVAKDESTESLRICNSEWYLQKLTDTSENAKRQMVHLAIARRNEDESEKTVKLLTKGHKIVLKELLAVRLVTKDEVVVYFTAAPLNSYGYKYLYSMRIAFPPKDDNTLEPVQCHTCLESGTNDDDDDDDDDNKNDALLPVVGQRTQCSWADVEFSSDALHYIIDCWSAKKFSSSLSQAIIIIKLHSRFILLLTWQIQGSQAAVGRGRVLDHESREAADPLRPSDSRTEARGGRAVVDRVARLRARREQPHESHPVRALEALRAHGLVQEQSVSLPEAAEAPRGHAAGVGSTDGSQRVRVIAVSIPGGSRTFRRALHFERKPGVSGELLMTREALDLMDRSAAAQHIAGNFDCIDQEAIGVIGERFGGHMSLKFASDHDCHSSCHVALKPWTTWQYYVHPFTIQPTTGASAGSRRRHFRREYLRPLVKGLADKSIAVQFEPAKSGTYESGLVEQLEKEKLMDRVVRLDSDEAAGECRVTRAALYEKIIRYLRECFELEQQQENTTPSDRT
uniref:Uncharacterized protein n=1 Tax=Trichogramma kaykai TaxID=54128 RepID=A0ABD2XB77_9HYME